MTSTETPLTLSDLIPTGGTCDADEILDLFLQWSTSAGFELYPAQEEGLLEIMEGRHVVLGTPTGSGKSLVALGLHFRALCRGEKSYYTAPIKALASEKFFALCKDLGAANVGMLTGDASINPDATVICCTAEVLSNLALRLGSEVEADSVVMDEFHYYSDRDRGVAWQVPLISLPKTQFLLMSATLGDTSTIRRHLEQQTEREVAEVTSDHRPVPLDYEYRETPLHETVQEVVEGARSPIYLVNFTQRDCAEVAQALTSMKLTDKEQKAKIRAAIGDARFDTPYGRELRRFLGFGIGVHHAGLLPRYRLLVEQLAQKGLLKVVSGTDTLGMGVNIPLRTVLFTRLSKYDGHKVSLLKVRDFQQIAGRAGRRGFDDQGSVVCQAPDHVIENKAAERKAKTDGRKRKKGGARKPRQGEVSWDRETFDRLVTSSPERLRSRFKLTHGMVLDLLQRDTDVDDPSVGNFHSLRTLVGASHEDDKAKDRLLSHAASLIRSLYRAGIVSMVTDIASGYRWVTVNDDLQVDFSLFHNLSLFLVDGIERLNADGPDYAVDLLSLAESVLEDPFVILRKQVDRAKTELINRLKADGVPYEERMARLDEVSHPQPCADFIFGAFDHFRGAHPWVGGDMAQPKSIAREMVEGYLGFTDYIRLYGLQRSEGVLLRYLSQVYKTLDQNVPDWAKSEGVWDIVGFLRAMLERVDTSLIDQWEGLRHPTVEATAPEEHQITHRNLVLEQIAADPRAFSSRLRAELHCLVRALARRDWEEAALAVHQGPEDSSTCWPPERIAEAMAPFYEDFDELLFDHSARLSDKTHIKSTEELCWEVKQILVDPTGDNLWCIHAVVDLEQPGALEGPVITIKDISL